jgi:hypothetical protein
MFVRAAFQFRKTGHDDISAHLRERFEDGFCEIWSHLATSELTIWLAQKVELEADATPDE